MIEEKYKIIGAIIFVILGIAFFVKVLPDAYDNPEPNQEYFKEVINYIGREPCCDSTWLDMCTQYKEENNVSFECFT